MSIERINPDTVYDPNNDFYSQVVKATGDTHVHVSGTVPLTADGELVDGDLREQTAAVVEMLDNSLAAAGASTSDLVRIRVLATDAEAYLEEAHDIVVDWYGDTKPTSTLHEVAGLASPAFDVEIEATAILDE